MSKCEGLKFLGELVFNRTYAKTDKKGVNETWEQMCDRIEEMHLEKFKYAGIDDIIKGAINSMRAKKIIGSARMQAFAGEGVKRCNTRAYNCAYLPIIDTQCFGEVLYLLACGTGVGYSVASYHISKLPAISEGFEQVFIIDDTKEAWADSIVRLIENPKTQFDYAKIRKKGMPLSTGGLASGPEPLRETHEAIRGILQNAAGRQLKPEEVADINCLIADAIIAGSTRRSATIVLFDQDSMLTYKSGDWWKTAPFRARANISRVFDKSKITREEFEKTLNMTFDNLYGEPGVILLHDVENSGVNPCAEIALNNFQMCNLSEVILNNVGNKDDFIKSVCDAAILGTLQAAYTDFKYLRKEWKTQCEKEALLGVSLTGQAMRQDLMKPEILREAAEWACIINRHIAGMIGINPAARVTTVKPSGSTSAVHGCTSGIHPAFSNYFIRRVEVQKASKLGKALIKHFGVSEYGSDGIIEQSLYNKDIIYVCVPCAMPDAITAESESTITLLERMKNVALNWIKPGHLSGANRHNVSLTAYYRYKDKNGNRNTAELNKIINWMWDNRDVYTGISLLDHADVKYDQAPFEKISPEEYETRMRKYRDKLNSFDFSAVNYKNNNDESKREFACSGGTCEIR